MFEGISSVRSFAHLEHNAESGPTYVDCYASPRMGPTCSNVGSTCQDAVNFTCVTGDVGVLPKILCVSMIIKQKLYIREGIAVGCVL